MLNMIRVKIGTDALGQFVGSQLPARLNNRTLAMYPLRLNVVQPGAFGRQKAWNDLNACLTLSPVSKRPAIVVTQPVTYFTTDVPGRVVPYQHQHPFAFSSQAFTNPFQPGCRDMAHGSSINEAQPYFSGVSAQQ